MVHRVNNRSKEAVDYVCGFNLHVFNPTFGSQFFFGLCTAITQKLGCEGMYIRAVVKAPVQKKD